MPQEKKNVDLSRLPGVVASSISKLSTVVVQGVWGASQWCAGAVSLQLRDPPAAAAARARLWREVKDEARFYWVGSKLLAAEVRTSSGLLLQVAQGKELTRRERLLLKRILTDMVRTLPLIVVAVVPFAELALPVLIKYNLLPSQFEKTELRHSSYKTRLGVRQNLHGILGEVLEEHTARQASTAAGSPAAPGAAAALSAQEVMARMEAVRRGVKLPPEDIVRVAAMFRDETVVSMLPRGQLATLAHYLGISTFSPDALMRRKVQKRLGDLKEDDALLFREGTQGLTKEELKAACDARGATSVGLTEAEYRAQLDEWLLLSVKHDISATLLLLSRSFMPLPAAAGGAASAASRGGSSGAGGGSSGAAAAAAAAPPAAFKLALSAPLPSASPATAAALQETVSAIGKEVVTEVVLEQVVVAPAAGAAPAAFTGASAAAAGRGVSASAPAAAAAASSAAAGGATPFSSEAPSPFPTTTAFNPPTATATATATAATATTTTLLTTTTATATTTTTTTAATAAAASATTSLSKAAIASIQLQLDALNAQNALIAAEAEAAAAEAERESVDSEDALNAAAQADAPPPQHHHHHQLQHHQHRAAVSPGGEPAVLRRGRGADAAAATAAQTPTTTTAPTTTIPTTTTTPAPTTTTTTPTTPYIRMRGADAASAAATASSAAASACAAREESALLTSLAVGVSLGVEKAAVEKMSAAAASAQAALVGGGRGGEGAGGGARATPPDSATLYLQAAMAKLASAAERELGAAEALSLGAFLKAVDERGDGELSEGELVAALEACRLLDGAGARAAAAALLRKLDTGSDGKVKVSNLIRYLDALAVGAKSQAK